VYSALGQLEPELVCVNSITGGRGRVAIDAGCNIGHYAYKLSSLFDKVYAFDANFDITAELEASKKENIEVIHKGLSESSGEAVFYLPVANGGGVLHGWGSLRKDNCPSASNLIETRVGLISLDSLNIADVDFIKIDVEGHEVELLAGAINTIRESRPIVLIEIKEVNMVKVSDFFASLNYRRLTLMDLVAIQGGEENFIFIPA
jgi:FkbM family methyltransferase